MRESLRLGSYRTAVSLCASGVVFALCMVAMFVLRGCFDVDVFSLGICGRNVVLSILQMFGIVTALLTTLVFSIRNKSVEYYVKFISDDIETHDPIGSSERLTNLFLLCLITTVFQFVALSIVGVNFELSVILVSLGVALGVACVVQYVYALFALEYLEIIIINAINAINAKVKKDAETKNKDFLPRYMKIPDEWNS